MTSPMSAESALPPFKLKHAGDMKHGHRHGMVGLPAETSLEEWLRNDVHEVPAEDGWA